MRRFFYLHPGLKKVVGICIAELVPTILGLVFALVFENFVILEVAYALFGVLCLLFAMLRNWNRDSRNFRANKTIVEDPKTDSYKEYKKFQRTLWVMGLANLLASHLVFVIFIK